MNVRKYTARQLQNGGVPVVDRLREQLAAILSRWDKLLAHDQQNTQLMDVANERANVAGGVTASAGDVDSMRNSPSSHETGLLEAQYPNNKSRRISRTLISL